MCLPQCKTEEGWDELSQKVERFTKEEMKQWCDHLNNMDENKRDEHINQTIHWGMYIYCFGSHYTKPSIIIAEVKDGVADDYLAPNPYWKEFDIDWDERLKEPLDHEILNPFEMKYRKQPEDGFITGTLTSTKDSE